MSELKLKKRIVQAVLFKSWVDMYSTFEAEFAGLPSWAQEIVLQDIGDAVQTRIAVMKKIQN